jgi:hypothetical protein
VNHRPNDAQCLTTPPPGDCNGPSGNGMCSNDNQCTMGTNGRCVQMGEGVEYCGCTYDTCMQDANCPTGDTCACHGSAYTDGEGNVCVPGNCRVDADCGAGGYCSPSVDTMGCGGGVAGYYCHTPQDQCVNDSDCGEGGGGEGVCVFSTSAGYWQCTVLGVCA